MPLRSALVLAAGLLAAGLSSAQPPPDTPPPLSSAAERVYESAKPRILQVRTLLQAAGRQSSIGSGFLVNADGLAITNYHVVSQFALDPRTYRLEYLAPDGAKGALKLLAIDVANDLAAVKLERTSMPFFEFDPRALAGRLPKGERIYAMGNPLDLGFTIVEGTYNGPVDKTYDKRIHFSGAINPGMSGGPVTGADARRRQGARGSRAPARCLAGHVLRGAEGQRVSQRRVRAVPRARERGAVGHVLGGDQRRPGAARARRREHYAPHERDRHLRLRPHPHRARGIHLFLLQGDRPQRIPVRPRALPARRDRVRRPRRQAPHRAGMPRRLRDPGGQPPGAARELVHARVSRIRGALQRHADRAHPGP